MASCAFTPLSSSSTRLAIGCEKLNATPGYFANSFSIASISSALLRPVFSKPSGLSVTIASMLLTGSGIAARFRATDLRDHVVDLRECLRHLLERRRRANAFVQAGRRRKRRAVEDGSFLEHRNELRAEKRDDARG